MGGASSRRTFVDDEGPPPPLLEIGDVHTRLTTFPALYVAPHQSSHGKTADKVETAEEASSDDEAAADVVEPRRAFHRRRLCYSFEVRLLPARARRWQLRKTAADFMRLQEALSRICGAATPPLPLAPLRLRALHERVRVSHQRLATQLRDFLLAVVALKRAWRYTAVREFFELSATSFDPLLGWKGKEGTLMASSDAVMGRGVPCIPSWTPFWFVLRDSYLAVYQDSMSADPVHVLLLDAGTAVYSSIVMPVKACGGACGAVAPLGSSYRRHARTFALLTEQGRLLLSASSRREAEHCE
jgi:hypothetical protein